MLTNVDGSDTLALAMPKPKTNVAARLDADVHEFVVERATNDDKTISATINDLLRGALKRAIAAEGRKTGATK